MKLKALLLFAMLLPASVMAGDLRNVAKPAVRDHYIDVTVYPDYRRRPWPMPDWNTFDNRVQLVGDRYLNAGKTKPGGSTGTVFRPNYDLLTGPSQKNFTDLLAPTKAAKPKLFIWNLGGYIWTFHPGGYVKYDFIEQLKSTLGDQFLGCDIGEQDGHYVNGYRGITRLSNDPFEEYLKLHLIQQRIAEDHADKSSLLTVMYNWHGPIRDGLVVSAAAECQNRGGVASAQVQYAFLRGAVRQFGATLAGDVAVFTSWDNYRTSLALRRRFLYSQYQWNSAILSCEDAYGPAPIVRDINQWLQGFIKEYPRPGPMHCPVALLTDPFQGWTASQTHVGQFKKHASQAYDPGDFLTHLLLNLVYPCYYDNGVWKDESRAIVPTPYGDEIEVVTSDCTAPILNGYGVVIVASDLPTGGSELRDRFDAYVRQGGHLIITAANARRLWPEWGIGKTRTTFAANSTVTFAASGAVVVEPLAYEAWKLDLDTIPGAVLTVSSAGTPLACDIAQGKGMISLLASPHGLNQTPRPMVTRSYPLWRQREISAPEQVQPYVLVEHVRRIFDAALRSQQLFAIDNDQLTYVVNRHADNTYWVGIYNSQLTWQPFAIRSLIGTIVSQQEIPLDNLAATYRFLPVGFEGDGKPSAATGIAAGEVRLFKVTVTSMAEAVRVVSPPVFPRLPRNRFVRMPTLPDLERSLLKWPTFFQHCDGVMLDWTEIRDIDREALLYDGCRWLNRQRLRFAIDFRPGQEDGSLGFGPDQAPATARLLAAIQDKLMLLDGARELLFSASTAAEVKTLDAIAGNPAFAAYRFHVLPLSGAAQAALGAAAPRLRPACLGTQPAAGGDPAEAGLMLLSPGGKPGDHVRTVAYPGVQVLDAVYDDWSAVYADVGTVWEQPRPGALVGKPVNRQEVAGIATPVIPNLYLALRDPGSVERAMRTNDPVWRDFAGVKLESALVWQMSADACQRLGQAMKRRRLKVMVDFSDHLNGWNGLTFQDLSARMKTPAIGNHARSQRVFDNVAAKLPLLGATDVLFVISPVTALTVTKGTPPAQVAANQATVDHFCRQLRGHGATGHLWYRPYRNQSKNEVADLIKATPGLKAALNLNADPDVKKGLSWAGDRLGMIILGGGTSALKERNAIISSDQYSGMMYGPLSLSPTPVEGLPATIPWVLDGDYRTMQEIQADVMKLKEGQLAKPSAPCE